MISNVYRTYFSHLNLYFLIFDMQRKRSHERSHETSSFIPAGFSRLVIASSANCSLSAELLGSTA